MAATPEYQQLLKQIRKKAKKEAAQNRRFFRRIKKKKPAGLTKAFREGHDDAFRHINCMKCANCCRTSLAVFGEADVRRVSAHFSMTKKEFIKKYLRPHPDYDYLIKTLPCPFLREDNLCGIYEIRPEGCRTYPPAKLRLTDEQLDVLHDNIGICPAVSEMVENIKSRFEV
jgi:hypothetical protein